MSEKEVGQDVKTEAVSDNVKDQAVASNEKAEDYSVPGYRFRELSEAKKGLEKELMGLKDSIKEREVAEAEEKEDWREMLARKNDGSFWSEFEPSAEGEEASSAIIDTETKDIDDADIWLDTLASISADEIEFNVCNKFVYSVLSFFLKLSCVGN